MGKLSNTWVIVITCSLWLSLCPPARGSAAATLEQELARAREQLRISLLTQSRIAAELQAGRESGTASPEVVAAYQSYGAQIEAIVTENRRLVARLEALQAKQVTQPSTTVDPASELSPDPSIPEARVVDPVTALDRELDASLAQFDGLLLKELDLVRQQSSETLQDLAAEAEAAAQRLKAQGIDLDVSGDPAADQEPSDGSPADPGQSTGQAGASSSTAETPPGHSQGTSDRSSGSQAGTQTAPQNGRRPGTDDPTGNEDSGSGTKGKPSQGQARYEDGADDDIVARQLREAAEKETDPVLKEKLWQEYEAYKKNQQ